LLPFNPEIEVKGLDDISAGNRPARAYEANRLGCACQCEPQSWWKLAWCEKTLAWNDAGM